MDLLFEHDRLYLHNASGFFGAVPMTITGARSTPSFHAVWNAHVLLAWLQSGVVSGKLPGAILLCADTYGLQCEEPLPLHCTRF